jgi:hypothetical protein
MWEEVYGKWRKPNWNPQPEKQEQLGQEDRKAIAKDQGGKKTSAPGHSMYGPKFWPSQMHLHSLRISTPGMVCEISRASPIVA